MKRVARIALLTISGLLLAPTASASCGSAFCTVNSNWTAETAATEIGDTLDFRFEYIDQDQLRSGSSRVSAGEFPEEHDEVSTQNRNLLARYSHTFNSRWGVSVNVPFVDREHFHVHNDEEGPEPERWAFSQIGDASIVGRYQFEGIGDPMKPWASGLTFGVKVPTGSINQVNEDGERAERSLQPGTGTTDLIAGAYFHQRLTRQDATLFAQAQFQHATGMHDEFEPGDRYHLDLGYRVGIGGRFGAMLQLNYLHKDRDAGAQAEPEDSGGDFVFLSPGLSYAFSDKVQAYMFYQLPLEQHVNGVQLTAGNALVVGLSAHL